MNRSTKRIVYALCIVAFILISIGLGLSLKELMIGEDMFNMADDSGYYKATFNRNGAHDIEFIGVRCKISNGACTVTLPTAQRADGVVLGFSDNKDDLVAKYKPGDVITLTSDVLLYVISYSTFKLNIPQNDVDYLEKDNLECTAYNENRTCKVLIPKFNKVGYENKGYSTSIESLTGYIYPNDEYELSKDTTIYPIYSTSSRKQSLNITNTFMYEDSFIEVEKGCRESIYSEYLKYLDGIKKHIPFLLLGNKITFVTDKSFDNIWGATYVGMNFGPRNLRSVDVRCSDNSYNDYYATMVHEMAHSWDFYYATKLGSNISSQNDVINLYDKYKNKSNRPFRDYSYSNIYEFMADMMRYYYFKYYEPRGSFKNLSYPSDIKKVLEKYICISKNNYDESKCK